MFLKMNHDVKLDYFAVTVQNLSSHSNLSEKERTTVAIVQF